MKLPLPLAAFVALPIAAVAASACSSSSSGPNAVTCGSTNEKLTVCAGGATVSGVDVSVYQGTVSWPKVKAAGKVFAIARVSDGIANPDTEFAANWPAMKSAGLLRGAYQFFRPGDDPVSQADMMLAAIGTLDADDMPPIMDIEVTDSQSAPTIQANMTKWLARIAQKTGRTPIIYTAAFMTNNIGNGFTSYPLWVANYGVSCPLMPSEWTKWKFWQSSSTATVAGISDKVDLDEFNGSLADLLSFLGASAANDGGADGAGDAGADDGGPVMAVDAGARNDGGATMGSGNPQTKDAGPVVTDPCAP